MGIDKLDDTLENLFDIIYLTIAIHMKIQLILIKFPKSKEIFICLMKKWRFQKC